MLCSDVPIQKAQEDILNRRSFVQSLAEVIVGYDAPESFSIGVYGPWGSGKTSVINMTIEAVESTSSDIVTLRFNPWLCSDAKQLITQFFKQLASAVQLKETNSDKLWRLIDSYSDVLEITGAFGTAGVFLSPMAKLLAGKAKMHTARNENDLQKKKNEIIAHLKQEHVKILVTIDDIDRLSEKEIVAVFQLVKSLADFPNTIYLLAFDHDVVVKALAAVQRGDGEEYLDKIIQVPVALPKASAKSVQDVLFAKLNAVICELPEEKWDKEAWAAMYTLGIKPYIRSIRDVIRFTNVFSLSYTLLKQETDAVDLLGLTCLQVFEPAVYEMLPLYQKQICGSSASYSANSDKERETLKQTLETLLRAAGINTQEAAEHILKLLFPRLQETSWLGGRTYHHAQFLVHHNVAAPERFARYFALALEQDDIASSIMEQLVFRADATEARLMLQSVSADGKIDVLMEELQAYCAQAEQMQITAERAEIIVSSLVRQWQSFEPKEDLSCFALPFDWKLMFCTRPLLERMDAQRRFDLLQRLFSDTDIAVYSLSLLLHDFETEHNRFVEQPKEQKTQQITLEQLLSLEQIFTCRVGGELERNTLIQQKGAMQALWLYEKIVPELAKEKTAHMVTDDLSLAMLIQQCVGHGRAGASLLYKTWNVSMNEIAKYIDPDEALMRMTGFVQQPDFQMLTQSKQEDIAAFLVKMEQKDMPRGALSKGIVAGQIQKKLSQLLPVG